VVVQELGLVAIWSFLLPAGCPAWMKGIRTGIYVIRIEYMHMLRAISIKQDKNWSWR